MRDWLRGLRLIFSASFHAAPRIALFGLSMEPLGVAVAALSALFIKRLVDGVSAGDTGQIASGAIAIAVTMMVGLILRVVGWPLRTRTMEETGTWLDARVLELSAALPGLEHTERAEYHDRIRNLNGGQYAGSIISLVSGFAAIGGILVGISLLAAIEPVLVLLPLFGLPSVFLGIKGEGVRHDAWETSAPMWRRSVAWFKLAIQSGPAKEIRLFGLEQEVLDRHASDRAAAIATSGRAAVVQAVYTSLGWLCFAVGYLGALALVAFKARRGEATIGDLMMAISVSSQLNGSVGNVADAIQGLAGRFRNAKHFLWLEDQVRQHARPGGAPAPRRLTDGIRFEGVTFTYPGTDEVVLRDVNLHLQPGTRVAIVGDNGAGKTTLVKLILGFYQPTQGRITVDGVALSDMDIEDWRRACSGGFQDYCRFHLRARDNVGIGDLPRIEEAEAVRAALSRAGASEVEAKMPKGLDTQLGRSFDEGIDLSMGQWQKLALGRAFMRDEPLVLVLDEPTSSLDAPTEAALFSRYAAVAEDRRARGAITVLVSHRFSTVRSADQIVVVEDGSIREVGTHAELMTRSGLYSELFTLQASAYL